MTILADREYNIITNKEREKKYMSTTLEISLKTEVQDFQIFDFLDLLPAEDEPTDLDSEAEEVCIQFIFTNYLEGCDNDNVDSTEFGGFNEIKLKIKNYLSLKRHNPDLYKKLDDTCPVPNGYSRLWR